MRNQRFGFSLVEMTVVATLSGLLLAVAVTVLITLQRQDDQIGLGYRRSTDLTRLADQFRTDVHQSIRVTLPEPNDTAGLVAKFQLLDGSRIEYRQVKQHLLRIHSATESRERQERFLFTPQTIFVLEKLPLAIAEGTPPEPVQTQRGQLARLIVNWPMNGTKYDAALQLAIVAEIGRDLPVRIFSAETNHAAP